MKYVAGLYVSSISCSMEKCILRQVPDKDANERFIYLWVLIILDCTAVRGAAALRGYQLAKNNHYWKCTLTSTGTINQ